MDNSLINLGILKKNGLFYRLDSRNVTFFIQNDLFKKVLPEDTVEYSIFHDKIIIDKIIKRDTIVTIGIIQNAYIKLPLVSHLFLDKINYNTEKLTIVLVSVSLNKINILKEYDTIIDGFIDYYKRINNKLNYKPTDLNVKENLYSFSDRKDLTYLDTFTIDPEDSTDFDDAISVDITNNTIYIHIVDIAELLKNKESEEYNSFYYGMTLYNPIKNCNILSDNLAENEFSLIINKDRFVITTELKLDNNKDVYFYSIYPSLIKVKHRYNYNEAVKLLESNDNRFLYLKELLNNRNWIYSKLNIPNRKLIIKNDNLKEIKLEYPTVIHKIIETLMVKNNICIMEHLNGKAPDRYHPETINKNNINCSSNLIENLEILKKYKSAFYSIEEKGHYGLNIERYLHFTSPIRRGFDIIIHKILRGYIFDMDLLKNILNHLNDREILNNKITKIYEKHYILKYLLESNKTYVATILNISNKGIEYLIEEILYKDCIPIYKIELNLENLNKNDRIMLKVLEIDLLEQKILKYEIRLK